MAPTTGALLDRSRVCDLGIWWVEGTKKQNKTQLVVEKKTDLGAVDMLASVKGGDIGSNGF